MSSDPHRDEVTRLLKDRSAGADRVFAAVYDELRRMAGDFMRRERPDHTLRPTALVHEAYIRLVHPQRVTWESRAHFFGMAARAMRQILVDHARRKTAEKRGGGLTRITLDEKLAGSDLRECDILDLHTSLRKLAIEDDRSARVAELRAFAGMTTRETACVLGVSRRTVEEDWRFAQLWLSRELSGGRG